MVKDAYLEKTLKDMFKQLSKELDIDDEADDAIQSWEKPSGKLFLRGKHDCWRKKQIRVTAKIISNQGLISWVLSDKPFNFIKIKNKS